MKTFSKEEIIAAVENMRDGDEILNILGIEKNPFPNVSSMIIFSIEELAVIAAMSHCLENANHIRQFIPGWKKSGSSIKLRIYQSLTGDDKNLNDFRGLVSELGKTFSGRLRS